MMKYLISVYSAPYTTEAPHTALAFSKAVIAAGHQLFPIFFYGESTRVASSLAHLPRDETNLHEAWKAFSLENNLDLHICVSSALREGLLTKEEALRQGKNHWNVESPFLVTGLGEFVEAMVLADRTVFFGG